MGSTKSFNIQTPATPNTQSAIATNCKLISSHTFPGDLGTIYPSDPDFFQVFHNLLDKNYGKLYMLSFTIRTFSPYKLTIKLSDQNRNEITHQRFYLQGESTILVNFLLPQPYGTDEAFYIDFLTDTDVAIQNITFYQK